MILDNADDVNVFFPYSNPGKNKIEGGQARVGTDAATEQRPLAAVLPKCQNGVILITSRSLDAAEKLTGSHQAIYQVSTMAEAQAFQLLQGKLNGDPGVEVASDLLLALDYIPLAITQAAAYINRRAPRISVTTYLKAMQESSQKKTSLLNSEYGDLRRDETVSNSIITTWQITFEQIRRERPSAGRLLSFMSFFNSQRIPEFVLHDYDAMDELDEETTSDDFEDDLDVLRSYSLVSLTVDPDVFEMHPLVQFCTRTWLSAMGQSEQWEQSFLQVMSEHFPDTTFETWPTCQILLPHIEPVLESMPIDAYLEDGAFLLQRNALYRFRTGDYAVAARLGLKAVETMTILLGKEHPGTLGSMNNLAVFYTQLGRLEESEYLLVHTLEIKRKTTGEEDSEVLTSMSNLAALYAKQGRLKEAEELEAKTLEIKKNTLGEEHPDTLTSMNNLAAFYQEQNRGKEAENLLVHTIEMRRTILGAEHPATLGSLSNLASLYLDQSLLKEAEELHAQILRTRRNIHGDKHPDTLTSMSRLADVYSSQGLIKQAEELETKALETKRKILGEEHPDTLISMNSLGLYYLEQGRLKEAEELHTQTLNIRKALGNDTPGTLTSMCNLASVYLEQRMYQKAEELNVQTLKMRREVLGEEHPDTLISMHNLGGAYECQDRFQEAKELIVEALEISKRVLGEDNIQTLDRMASLGYVLWQQGQFEDALPLLRESTALLKSRHGSEHPKSKYWGRILVKYERELKERQ